MLSYLGVLRCALLALLVAAAACASDDPAPSGDPTGPGDPGDSDPGGPGKADDPGGVAPRFDPPANCDPAPSVQEVWDHSIASPAVTVLGSAYHGAADAVTNPGKDVSFSARFVYGLVLKDLEDETVLGYIERGDCSWESLGDAVTDDDGVATFTIPGDMLTEPGAYNVELAVRGDDSRVRGTVWVEPAGVDAVVFDIDGTLTTSDSELAEELLLGSEPEMYQAADQVLARYTDAGYFPIYITGRPVYVELMTRDWLAARGLPAGPLFLTSGITEGLFSVEDYKRETMLDLEDRAGLDLPFAHGNATTDICAYATAGIAPAATYIIGTHRGEACDGFDPTVAVLDYPTLLDDLDPPPADYQH